MPSVDLDTATTNAHDPSHQARRSSRSTRSPSLTRAAAASRAAPTSPTATKRSPSPVINFNTPLSTENPTGVKSITRKVIRRLEGLGHLEMVGMDVPVTEEEEETLTPSEEQEIETVLYAIGKETVKKAEALGETQNGHSNGNGHIKKEKKEKPDLEIPRKVLHSSIGFFTLYLYVSEGDVRTIVMVLWMALAIIVPADLLRFNSRRFARTYEKVLGFLMRESEKNSINGVVYYILGVNFVLSLYPQDVATVAILILSWADTAASTFGRLYGSYMRKLPARLPILRLPLAPRKSLVGFLAAAATGSAIALGFWGSIAPMRAGGQDLTWSWDEGVRQVAQGTEPKALGGGGALGLLAISIVAGIVSGISEALDLGALDDNLTLPIISGGCILGFLKLLGIAASWFSS
ncbi:CTP-dependent diacylglycerol kinase 1 [Psilocybe cubensis]|uniref:Phosphatidate cytidylyltransferase n=2 Tax=Psilocybe cubensis TaxID=181762 RepID=A0A8H8CHT5_PSICU|nr:CTP-dependent diacylglycerol kinase 1 [Psilocybe cubensis]KAH9474900.1 CTP-dependent diacylglycerol kinase 1 [Psilocybe cubensis]